MGKMQMRWSPERILQQSQLEAHRIRYIHNPEPLLEVPNQWYTCIIHKGLETLDRRRNSSQGYERVPRP
jgi:hypothetical protein